ncbi:MAG TPA: hypothetical protein VFO76_11485 [Candidatus Kapabacteria bacterium]|nr:hypothetical protein [Candidatus Kapabacteria bacterium]
MSKTSQWIANSLFILSCIFLPWRNLGGPFGGHTATDGHFAGYHTLLSVPQGLALDSMIFMLQLILIGAIILWTETLVRSNLEGLKLKYIGATLLLATIAIVISPIAESTLIPGTLGEIEDVFSGYGFLFTNTDVVAPKIILIELIALFGLMTLAMKFHSKRIAARPVLLSIEEQDLTIETNDSFNNMKFA